jgi:hypothetical protein
MYNGNLLILYFFLGHCVSGLVEGFSEKQWLTKLENDSIKKTMKTTMTTTTTTTKEGESFVPITAVSPKDLYHFYIVYHSTILRTYPFRPLQMIQLGIANQSMMDFIKGQPLLDDGHWEEEEQHQQQQQQQEVLIPPRVMKGMDKSHFLDRMMDIVGNKCLVFAAIFEMGILGPAFRGRDDVSFIYMSASTVLGVTCVKELERAYREIHLDEYTAAWNSECIAEIASPASQAVNVLLRIFCDTATVNPMTVEVPYMTFCCE